MRKIDISLFSVGKKFHDWTITSKPFPHTTPSKTRLAVKAKCKCGFEAAVNLSNLKSGRSRSCRDCANARGNAGKNKTHGMSNTPTFYSWTAMKARCCRKSDKDYHRYGAVGVSVCSRWLESFENFYADMGERPKNTTLDRYHPEWRSGDTPLPYSPETCRWATAKEQANNKAVTFFVEYDGERLSASEWSDRTGIPRAKITRRIRLGWSSAQALGFEDGPIKSIGRWNRETASAMGVSQATVIRRCKAGLLSRSIK